MADEYTPTTSEVRSVWAAWAEYGGLTSAPSGFDDDHLAEFDRWLAAHDRDTAARAWDEGERHESHTLTTFGQFCPHGTRCNPYREGDPT